METTNFKTTTNTIKTETYSKFDEALELVRGLKNENDAIKAENKKLKAAIKDYEGMIKKYEATLRIVKANLDEAAKEIGCITPAPAAKPAAAEPAPHETKKPAPEVKRMTSEEANRYMAEMLMNLFN